MQYYILNLKRLKNISLFTPKKDTILLDSILEKVLLLYSRFLTVAKTFQPEGKQMTRSEAEIILSEVQQPWYWTMIQRRGTEIYGLQVKTATMRRPRRFFHAQAAVMFAVGTYARKPAR